jgi:hypothetical protein
MERNWSRRTKNASPFEAVENGSIAERLAKLGYTPDDVDFRRDVPSARGPRRRHAPVPESGDPRQRRGVLPGGEALRAAGDAAGPMDRADLRAIFSAGLRFNLLENER